MKRAIVFSGGGKFGAIQIGALKSMLKAHPDVEYDVVSGISVGALAASYIASAPKGELLFAVAELEALWRGFQGNKSIYKKRIFGLLSGFFRKGLYNTKPLQDLIEKQIHTDKIIESGRELYIGVVNLHNGEYKEVTPLDENFKRYIYASAAFPGYFPPAVIEGSMYRDGGLRNMIPAKNAISSGCKTIDIFLCRPNRMKMTHENHEIKNLIDDMSRTLDISYGEIWREDFEPYIHAVQQGVEVNIYAPQQIRWRDPLNFDPKEINEMILMGSTIKPISLEEFLEIEIERMPVCTSKVSTKSASTMQSDIHQHSHETSE